MAQLGRNIHSSEVFKGACVCFEEWGRERRRERRQRQTTKGPACHAKKTEFILQTGNH